MLAELQLGCGDGFLDVLRAPRTDDRHLHGRIRQRPRHRQLSDRAREILRGKALELAHRLEVAVEGLARERGIPAPPVAALEGRVLVEATGEQPVCERSVGEYSDLVRACVRQDVRLDSAAEQAVRDLVGLHRPRARELRHLGGAEVGDADVANLAFVDELVERRGGFGERNVRVGPVHLIEIDVVDSERAQAVVDALAKPLAARIAGETVVGHPQSALRRDHDRFAVRVELCAQSLREEALRGAESVALRSVEQVDAELARLADRVDRAPLAERSPFASEFPRAECDRGDRQAGRSKRDCLHGSSPIATSVPASRGGRCDP